MTDFAFLRDMVGAGPAGTAGSTPHHATTALVEAVAACPITLDEDVLLVEDGVGAFFDEGVQFRDGVATGRPGKELLLVHVKLRSVVAQGAGMVVLWVVLPTSGAGGPLRDQNKSTIYDKTLIDTNSQQEACQKLRNSRMSSGKFAKCCSANGF